KYRPGQNVGHTSRRALDDNCWPAVDLASAPVPDPSQLIPGFFRVLPQAVVENGLPIAFEVGNRPGSAARYGPAASGGPSRAPSVTASEGWPTARARCRGPRARSSPGNAAGQRDRRQYWPARRREAWRRSEPPSEALPSGGLT